MVVPFQSGVSRIGTWMSVRMDELGELRIILEENQELKQQIAELTVPTQTHVKINSRYLLGIENLSLFLFTTGLMNISAPFLLNKQLICSYHLL